MSSRDNPFCILKNYHISGLGDWVDSRTVGSKQEQVLEGKLVQLGLIVLVEVSERYASGAVQREF